MSSAARLDDLRLLAAGCERRERLRGGGSRDDVRGRLASKIGILPGTLYNLARQRLKRIDEDLRLRLTAYAIKDLETAIGGLNHELDVARLLGAEPTSPRVQEIERHLSTAKALLREAKPEDVA